MASISSPNVLQIKNAAGVVVTGFARSIRFFGGIVVTDIGNGQADVDGTGAAGNPWDVLGNAGGGLLLGTNTANAWSMIVDALQRAGFESDGRYFISAPGSKKHILALDVNPTSGAGVAADLGSIALANVAGSASAWLKTGAPDTSWTQIPLSTVMNWALTGNNLTGGTPETPNEVFGSLNDYDVVFQRNSIEVARFIDNGAGARGLVIGHNTFTGGAPASLQLTASGNGAVINRGVFSPAANSVVAASRIGRLTTSGAASDLIGLPTQTDRSQAWTFFIIGRRTGGAGAPGDTIAFRYRVLTTNVAGVCTLLGAVSEVSETTLIPGATVGFTAVGSNLRLTVNGVAGYDIKWGFAAELIDA